MLEGIFNQPQGRSTDRYQSSSWLYFISTEKSITISPREKYNFIFVSSLNTETDNSIPTHTHLGLNDKNVIATLMSVQFMEASISKAQILESESSDKHDLISYQQIDAFINGIFITGVNMSKNKLTILLFFSVCMIWGTTWFAMEVAVSTIPPLFATGMRFLIACPILIFLARVLNQPLLFPRGKEHWVIVVSIFYFAIPFTLMITGEMFISSGLASIIFANMPIAVMMTSTLFLGLRLAAHQIFGVFTAVVSLCVILSNELAIGGDAIFLGSAALSIAVLIHAFMYVLVQKYCAEIQVMTYNVVPSFIAALLLIIGSLLFEKPNTLAFSPQSIIAVAYLGMFASVGGIVAYFKLGNVSSPFVASLCFLIFPLIALSINAYISGNVISDQSLFMLIPLLIGVLFAKLDLRSRIFGHDSNR